MSVQGLNRDWAGQVADPAMSAMALLATVGPKKERPVVMDSGLQAQETLLKRQAAVYDVGDRRRAYRLV